MTKREPATMYVTVTEGNRVRDPVTRRALPELEVHRVPRTRFWLRRLAEGALTEAPAPDHDSETEES